MAEQFLLKANPSHALGPDCEGQSSGGGGGPVAGAWALLGDYCMLAGPAQVHPTPADKRKGPREFR